SAAPTIIEYPVPTSDSGPNNITSGPDGNLWFTEYSGSKIGRFDLVKGNTGPGITNQPANQTVNSRSVLTFAAAAAGRPGPTVQWQISTNGGTSFSPLSGQTTSAMNVMATGAMSGNQYRAVFTNVVGNAISDVAVLVVDSAPVITTQPVDQTVAAGNTATFS